MYLTQKKKKNFKSKWNMEKYPRESRDRVQLEKREAVSLRA